MRALILAAALGLATPVEASAVTLIFKVDVTSRWDGSGLFMPFSFLWKWDVSNTPITGANHGVPPEWTQYREFFLPTVYEPEPSDFLALIGKEVAFAGGVETPFFQVSKYVNVYTDAPSYSSYLFNIQQDIDKVEDLGGGSMHEAFFTTGIYDSSTFSTLDRSKLDYAGLLKLASEIGPLKWYGWADDTFIDPQHAYSYNYQVEYNGTATLIGYSVPEPATWLLMIGGFGLAGAAIRRTTGGLSAR